MNSQLANVDISLKSLPQHLSWNCASHFYMRICITSDGHLEMFFENSVSSIYIHIYIYMCVCVCVCVCRLHSLFLSSNGAALHNVIKHVSTHIVCRMYV